MAVVTRRKSAKKGQRWQPPKDYNRQIQRMRIAVTENSRSLGLSQAKSSVLKILFYNKETTRHGSRNIRIQQCFSSFLNCTEESKTNKFLTRWGKKQVAQICKTIAEIEEQQDSRSGNWRGRDEEQFSRVTHAQRKRTRSEKWERRDVPSGETKRVIFWRN